MSEKLPESEPIPDLAVAANDESFGAANDAVYEVPSAEVIDITTGESYLAPGESIIEELTPSEPTVSAEQDQLIPSSYEAAMRRFGLDPNVPPIDSIPEAAASETVLEDQGEAMQALIEGIPSISPTPKTEAAPLTAVDFDPTVAAEVSQVVANEVVPAQSAEVIPQRKEVPEDILNSYKERFGINKEDLENVEGFADLSRGQQRQVLENLAQITIGKIHAEAVDGQSKEFNEKQKDAKFLGRVWNGLKNSVTKKFDIVNREKKLAAEIQKGGISEHKDALEQMTKGMKELGPAVKEAEDGTLEVQFIETNGMSPEVAKVAEVFNEQGTKLSKIPYEWSLDSASAEQRKAYDAAKETYELQRSVLMEQMKKEGGDEKAIKAMAQTESVIEMQRFIQTCPDAAKGLEGIENQNAWTAALGSVATERGLYMAGGALARTALGAVVGFAAAPAVAAIIGGVKSWKRTGDELVAQDAAQRRGEVIPETEKVKAAKTRIEEINVALANVDDERVKAELGAELATLSKTVRGTTKNMVAAFNEADIAGDKEAESGDRRRGATAKLEYLKAQIASIDEQLASGPAADEAGNLAEKKAKLAAQLDRRVNYTKMKVSEGKMVFGAEGERLGNQYALMRSMAEAEAVLGGTEATDKNGDKAERRLAKMLNATDEEIKDARFKKKLGQAVKAGVIGGALAGVGAAAADAVKWMNGASGTLAEKAFGDAGHVKAEIAGAVSAAKGSAAAAISSAKEEAAALGSRIVAGIEQQSNLEYQPFVDGSQALINHAPQPEMINGLDLPPDYVFPAQETPINGLDLPPDYVFPTQETPINGLDLPPDYKFPTSPNEEWVETPSGLHVLREDLVTAEAAPLHVVVPGENLSVIFSREIPGSSNADVVRLLKSMSPEQLKGIGVSSGNPDLIYPGDNINVGRMREILDASPSKVASSEGYVDGSRGLVRGTGGGGGPTPPIGTEAASSGTVLYENDGTSSVAGAKEATPADWYTEPAKTETVKVPPPPPPPAFMTENAAGPVKHEVPWEEANTVRAREELVATQGKATGVVEKLIDPNRPGANPLDQSEAMTYFGAEGTANRDLAEKMLREVGRYPNKAELKVFQQYQATNPAAAKSLLEHMQSGGAMTENEALRLGAKNYDPEYMNSAQRRLFREDAYKPGVARPETTPGLRTGIDAPPVPARTLSQLSQGEIERWPADNPSPWPVNQGEASELYGDLGTTNRTLAENMKQVLGRYPNEEEYLGFRKVKDINPNASRNMLLAMKQSPKSFAQVRVMTQSALSNQPAPVVAPTARNMTGLEVNNAIRSATAGSSGSVKRVADMIGQQAASGVSITKGAGAVISQSTDNPALKAVGQFLNKAG